MALMHFSQSSFFTPTMMFSSEEPWSIILTFTEASAMASTGFDNLPHNGSINNTLTVVHLTHKEAYKHYWWSNTVIPVIGTVLTAVIAQFGVV